MVPETCWPSDVAHLLEIGQAVVQQLVRAMVRQTNCLHRSGFVWLVCSGILGGHAPYKILAHQINVEPTKFRHFLLAPLLHNLIFGRCGYVSM